MREIIVLILLLVVSSPSFACRNTIPESEARKAIALEPNAGSKTCADLPEEKCICFDGIDWKDVDFIDGQLIPNPDKKFARELAEKNAIEAQKAKEDKCKSFSFKGTTIAAIRIELNEWKECK